MKKKQTKSKKRINYGNWNTLDFKGDFYEFKGNLYKKDFTVAGMILKDFRNGVESLTNVLRKMEEEYNLERKL